MWITREFLRLRIKNFQGITFILTRTYGEIFKSALVYLWFKKAALQKCWCCENMEQIYRRTPTPKCGFNKAALQTTLRHGCSPVNLLHIFRTSFLKSTSEGLLLHQKLRQLSLTVIFTFVLLRLAFDIFALLFFSSKQSIVIFLLLLIFLF